MRTLTLLLVITAYSTICNAQSLRGLDRSPLDIAYLPDNFAHDREPGEEAIAKVVYSRPQKNDRIVFGGLVPYNKVWRTGANENTEIHFYKDVVFNGEKIKAGTYSMFTIPGEDSWIIILNSDVDYWGSFSYNEDNDVLRTEVETKINNEAVEAFTIQFEKENGSKATMKLAWDTTLVEIPIEY